MRWFSIGEFFRYERPQKGRLRSFYQLNADIFDEADTTAEVQLIALAIDLYRSFGLTSANFAVRLSDRTLWLEYLGTLGLASDAPMSILQIIDNWEREEPAEIRKKLASLCKGGQQENELYQTIISLREVKSMDDLQRTLENIPGNLEPFDKVNSRIETWRTLLADLKAIGLENFIQVDLGIVRGLAYYTGFVFEIFEKQGKSRALGGGGRYNDLIQKLGGPSMPAVGFALGDVTTLDLLTSLNLLPAFVQSCDLYLAYTSEPTRAKALDLLPKLREAGYSVEISLKPLGFGKQLKAADKAGARKVVIIGDDELAKNACKVKDLSAKSEVEVPLEKLLEHLRQD